MPEKKNWTEKEVAELQRLAKRQIGAATIGKRLGRSASSVQNKAMILRISVGKRGGHRRKNK